MATICLVACVKSKQSQPAKAEDLYTSALFEKARQFAKSQCDRWYILSAKHGLLEPDSIVEPYNQTLNKYSKQEKKAWAVKVFQQLKRVVEPSDRIVFLAGENYREDLCRYLEECGIEVEVPMKSLSIGNQLKYLNLEGHSSNLNQFYSLMNILEEGLSGKKDFSCITPRDNIPEKGIYFFFEEGEKRSGCDQYRVTRVGTHGVSRGSQSTLWQRLKAHRGKIDGGGNHRGSIFRLHVGNALIEKYRYSQQYPFWGIGQSAQKQIIVKEEKLERLVSEYIGKMKILWLAVNDSPGPSSDRAFLERNIIGLLTSSNIDKSSSAWLGRYSSKKVIRECGIWNLNHVGSRYHKDFLSVFKYYVEVTIGLKESPKGSIAPEGWNDRTNNRDANQLSFWEG